MTRPSLAGIEQRAAAATEGPWDYYRPHYASGYHEITRDQEALACQVSGWDAAFIAAARTAVPALTAAVRDVLALHYAEPYAQGPDYCAECDLQSPCPTVRALAAHLDLTDPEGEPT